MNINLPKLVLSVVICLLVGFIGSFFTISSIPTWYTFLNKPDFAPPNWVFGPVWTTLYIMMGVSLYLIWNSSKKTRQAGIKLFLFQLLLNFTWSLIFFGLRNPFLAFVDIIGLWILIFLTIKYFLRISRLASYLMIPYLIWVSFASILNLMIVLLN